MLHQTLPILGQLWQLFEVSQILEFLRLTAGPGCSKLTTTLFFQTYEAPGRLAQSVGHLTRKSGVLGSIPGLATYFCFSSTFSRRAVVSYWRKYVHKVLVNRLGGLSLPRKSVVRLTDRPDMTLGIYCGRKTTKQKIKQMKQKL